MKFLAAHARTVGSVTADSVRTSSNQSMPNRKELMTSGITFIAWFCSWTTHDNGYAAHDDQPASLLPHLSDADPTAYRDTFEIAKLLKLQDIRLDFKK